MDHVAAAADGDTVHLDQDYFWSIGEDELYEVYNTPSDLTLGQLSWSGGHLTDLLSDPDGAIGYHLVWLSEVLRAIGHKIPCPAASRAVELPPMPDVKHDGDIRCHRYSFLVVQIDVEIHRSATSKSTALTRHATVRSAILTGGLRS